MHLTPLSQGGLSLEFDGTDPKVVLSELGKIGSVTTKPGIDLWTVTLDGEEMIMLGDWEDYCLIASSERGARLLREVFDRLSPTADAIAAE